MLIVIDDTLGQSDIFANTSHAVDPTQVRYVSTRPCPSGHVGDRYVRNGACVICQLEASGLWRNANRKRHQAACKAWDIRNPERKAATGKAWVARNFERKKATTDAWKVANPERYAARMKAWNEANPELIRHYDRVKRAKRDAASGSHTKAQVATLFILQKAKCGNCGTSLKRGYNVDHKMPLARGGTDDITNLECLCPPCNNRKRAKLPEVWAKENGRLI